MKKITDYTEAVMHKYETGTAKGMDIGFQTLDSLVSFKLGYTTYLLGFAAAGKTEFHLEILFNLTAQYGCKHALLSPEIGGVDDVIAELISKHLRKPFYKSSYNAASEKEIFNAMAELSESFFPLDSDLKDYDLETFFADCDQIEAAHRIKLSTTSLDPWNDLSEELSKHGNREDKYLTWALKRVRQNAKVKNRHNFIVTHAKDMPPIALKSVTGGETFCTAVPTLQAFAGGQVWGRRAFNVLGVWRPEAGAINPVDSTPFLENEAVILSLKSKPKGVGKKGKASLYFDWQQNRYWEYATIGGISEKCYAFEADKKLKGNLAPEQQQFTMPISTSFTNEELF